MLFCGLAAHYIVFPFCLFVANSLLTHCRSKLVNDERMMARNQAMDASAAMAGKHPYIFVFQPFIAFLAGP